MYCNISVFQYGTRYFLGDYDTAIEQWANHHESIDIYEFFKLYKYVELIVKKSS